MEAGSSPASTGRRRRRGRGWTPPDRRKPRPGPARSPSSPAPSNDGEPPPLPPGADVEVRIDGRGFFGNWYASTVIRYDPARGRRSTARYTVTYTDLLDNDHGGALTERFAATHVRPRPPHPESPPRFLLYDKVEAFHNDGWWSSIVFSTAPESVTVAFPITREVISFPPDLVRPRRDYIGGGDWVPSTAVVAVWRKGEVGVYEVGEKVKVWKKRHFFLGTVIKVIDDLSYVVEYSDLVKKGGVGAAKVTEYLHCQFIMPAVDDVPLENVATLAEGSEHASVSMMATALAAVENSPESINPRNSGSPLYGHSRAPKIDACDCDKVQNHLVRKRKQIHKIYSSKKIISEKTKCFEEPQSLHNSLESPTSGQESGIDEVIGSQRESFLILASTRQILDRTVDKINSNEVTYQEHVGMSPLSFQSASNGLTAPSSGCRENRHADALGKNIDTQVPFVKASRFWSQIEEMDVFKDFRQQPHFLPLQEYLPGLREGFAFGLMMSFNHFVESMRKSSIADNERSFEEKKSMLDELKTHGFDVQYFETFLDKVIEVKIEYTKHLEEESTVEAEKLGAISSLSRNDSLLSEVDKSLAELTQKVEDLQKEGQLIEERKDNEEKLLELNVTESSIKKALDDDKRLFDSILASMLRSS